MLSTWISELKSMVSNGLMSDKRRGFTHNFPSNHSMNTTLTWFPLQNASRHRQFRLRRDSCLHFRLELFV
jgi:hypothetical protein